MKIIQNLFSCTRKNDVDREATQKGNAPLVTKLVSADNISYATLRGIEPIHSGATKRFRSSMKNASVENRLRNLEPVLQKKMEHYISKFDAEAKRVVILAYYSGKLNTHIDNHAVNIISADQEGAKNNIKAYRQALLDAVLGLQIPQGLTEGGPSILVDQVTDLYSKAGFSYSVRRKDGANDKVCNDVDRVKNSIKNVVDNIAGSIAREFNTASPEAFQDKLKITTQEFEADIYNAKNGYPNKKGKLLDVSGKRFVPLATIPELELYEREYKVTEV